MKPENELVIAFSLGSIIDTKKAEEVFESKGTLAYHDILKKHKEKNSIFAPGPALGTLMALRRLDKEIPDDILKISFVLTSKIDANPSIHSVLFDSMTHYFKENKVDVDIEDHRYGFDMIALTAGKPVEPFLKITEADLVFTTSESSAQKMFLNGINSVCIPNVSRETNEELYQRRHGDIVVFCDYDGVMGDSKSESIYQEAEKLEEETGVQAFLSYEERLKDIPMELGPLGETIKKLGKAVRHQKEIQMKSGEKQDIEMEIVVVTARSGQSSERFFKTIEHHDIEISSIYMMMGRNKNKILKELGNMNKGNTLLFFDDSRTHFTRSLKLADIASIWVPNDENTKEQ